MQKEILVQLTRIADALELANGTSKKIINAVEKETPQADVEVKSYSHEDLKALCLSKSREDMSNKPKLKALLKSYGAAKANDVKKEDLATIITRITEEDY